MKMVFNNLFKHKNFRSTNLLKLLNNTQTRVTINCIFKNNLNFSFSSLSPTGLESQFIYSQQAITPSQISSMLIDTLTEKSTKQQILHQLSLYHSKVIPFNYDYFTQSLKHLIPYQTTLKLNEIFLIYQLAIEYKISSPFFERHLQNEIYCRLYVATRNQLTNYDQQLQKKMNNLYKKLQLQSKDHFNLITQQYKHIFENAEKEEKQENKQNNTNNKIEEEKQKNQIIQPMYEYNLKGMKPVEKAQQRKKHSKNISIHELNQISNIILNSNSRNIDFHQLLLEVFTCRIDQKQSNKLQLSEKKKDKLKQIQFTADLLVSYTKLTVNMLQLLMSKVHNPEIKATAATKRSIKSIYKLQAFYYYQITKLVEQKHLLSAEKASLGHLNQFVNVLSSFPIKRRSFKKSFGIKIIQSLVQHRMIAENVRLGEEYEQILMKFFQLSKYDNKLLQHFQKKIQSYQRTKIQQSNQQNEQKKQITQQKEQNEMFKIPESLFKKVTKKKNKPKRKLNQEEQIVIDCTQQVSEKNYEQKKQSSTTSN